MKRFAMICAAILMAFGAAAGAEFNLVKAHFSTPVTAGVTELPAGNVTIQVLDVGVDSDACWSAPNPAPQTTLLVNRISRPANYNGPEATVELERKGDMPWCSIRSGSRIPQGFQVIR